jgi:prepilin-type N-terminal cleavage/methylation domain-containing protein
VPTRPSDTGFTLIEVLIAVLIVSLVFGLLLESVTRNLSDISRARAGARSAQLAADRVRQMKLSIETGEKLEDGVKDGVFEEPDEDMHWEMRVTPQTLPLPADYKGELPPSPLFAAPNEPRPRADTETGAEPPLRLVEVRVFSADEDPNSVDPFVVLLTAPPDPGQLQQLQQQQQQLNQNKANGQTGASQGNNPNQPAGMMGGRKR